MAILDGQALAKKIKEKLKSQVKNLNPKPGLAVILVGDDPASEIYVKGKENDCKEVGFYSEVIKLPKQTTEQELLAKVEELNNRKEIHGFIVQLPIPKEIDSRKVIESISPIKDADGFTTFSVGNMLINNNKILPATPKGIMKLFEEYDIDLEGKNAVVIGRSNIVGKPISVLLQQKSATVTMCHSKTKNIENFTRHADIIIAAVGVPNLLKADMVKDGAVVIDVGINKKDGKMVGDADFDNLVDKCLITPVPGGVGPLTRAMLLTNTLECYKLQN